MLKMEFIALESKIPCHVHPTQAIHSSFSNTILLKIT